VPIGRLYRFVLYNKISINMVFNFEQTIVQSTIMDFFSSVNNFIFIDEHFILFSVDKQIKK